MPPMILLYGCPEHFKNYRQALESSGVRVAFTGDGAKPGTCDGLLLAGGGDLSPAYYAQPCAGAFAPDRERDVSEMELLEAFVSAKKPILGICRGMQVINVFFGGTLIQDLPGHGTIDGADRLHPVTTEPGCFLESLYGVRCVVNSAHHQAVDRSGEHLRITQRSDDGVPEALEHALLPIWGVQWHPERLTGTFFQSGAVDGRRIFNFFMSYFL